MIIRPETTLDYIAIREINIAAFADQPFSQQTEHLIVEALRAADALTISLVAENRTKSSRTHCILSSHHRRPESIMVCPWTDWRTALHATAGNWQQTRQQRTGLLAQPECGRLRAGGSTFVLRSLRISPLF
jgi:hypothetical protein